jgi:hypothetical protein
MPRTTWSSGGWIAPERSTVLYDFDQVPKLAGDYAGGRIDSYFPMYRVNGNEE